METRVHISGATAAATPWLRWRAAALWAGAALTDTDLYLYYVARHRRVGPRGAVRYYNTLAGRRERAVKLLHAPVAPALMLLLVRRSPALAAFGAGVLLHQLQDRAGKAPYRRMRRAIEARGGGGCEGCGAREASLALMEPRFVGGAGGKEDFGPAHWRLLCRRCNEVRE